MKDQILITDSLFIFPEHEQILKDAGFDIQRIDKPAATEEELIEDIKGKVGYILGGIEKVTDQVINSADKLKAIVFTGIDYKSFIPSWKIATEKGIAIANTPDCPTHAVAEWAITMALAMNRNIFDLGRAGKKDFLTTRGLENQKIGVVGFGRIGREITKMIQPFRPQSISYYSQHKHEDSEQSLGINYLELSHLLNESDIIFLCVPSFAGKDFLGASELALIKNGALLVSIVSDGVVNETALLAELQKGRIRAASDHPLKDSAANELPLSTWFCFKNSNAFNTFNELKYTSDTAVQSLLNLLKTGEDKNKVN